MGGDRLAPHLLLEHPPRHLCVVLNAHTGYIWVNECLVLHKTFSIKIKPDWGVTVANESSKTNGLVVKRGETKAPSEIVAVFLAGNETWLQKKHVGLH